MFEYIKLRIVARRYVHRLRKQLAQDFGALARDSRSDIYTPAQIRRSVAEARLNPNYIALAYANFLPKADFDALRDEMPIKFDYEAARTMFAIMEPVRLESTTGKALHHDLFW
jgi:hypothetical protein